MAEWISLLHRFGRALDLHEERLLLAGQPGGAQRATIRRFLTTEDSSGVGRGEGEARGKCLPSRRLDERKEQRERRLALEAPRAPRAVRASYGDTDHTACTRVGLGW